MLQRLQASRGFKSVNLEKAYHSSRSWLYMVFSNDIGEVPYPVLTLMGLGGQVVLVGH
jgi:hypothetical protein